ncbi:MAG: hypothetical protein JW808_11075 [Victivallales bacterium]|nr:hypothetical protein [Victivallales bacterium]
MPTYEYICNSCKHEFEVFQKMTENPLRKCPECKRNMLKRKIGTGAGIIFKGSGFYQTDYRSKSYTEAAKKEKSEPATSSTPESKTTPAETKKETAKAG